MDASKYRKKQIQIQSPDLKEENNDTLIRDHVNRQHPGN